MQTNVLEYLEHTVAQMPEKAAYVDDEIKLSFEEVYERSRRIGSCLASGLACREPVIIYMKKSPCTVTAFFGAIYAGCFYVPVDDEMPRRRIELILESTKARFLIYDHTTCKQAKELGFSGKLLSYEECIGNQLEEETLGRIRDNALDTDPIYILFTSGSTGMPKGVVGHHRGVIDYIEGLSEVLAFGEDTVFGNQTPLYVDACMKELYPTIRCGATTYFIPKEYFMLPVKLVEYLNTYQINTICWVVSALTMISAFGTFDVVKPEYLHTVGFGSEVFPVKQFNIWKKALPDVEFYNLYGPTEATGVSCYYHADCLFQESEKIPVGRPFKNTQILLLDEEGKEVPAGSDGEICIKGSGLTHGYFNDPQRTAEVFVQNPLNPYYMEYIYRTGDIGKWNSNGELVFISRKDYQIKHMGHRIELGEIEADGALVDGVKACCCVFIAENSKIVLFYTGSIDERRITAALRDRLPRYMMPNAMIKLEELPLTANGKMDRLRMKEIYMDRQKSRHKHKKDKGE